MSLPFFILWLALKLGLVSFINASTIISVPYYEATVGLSKNTITKSLTLNGSDKIIVRSDGEFQDDLSILQIKQSQSSASSFCSIKDRKLLLSQVASTPLYIAINQVDSNLFNLQSPPTLVISWGLLSAKASLNYANLMSVDSKLSLSLYKVDPKAQNTDLVIQVGSIDLSSLILQENMLNGDISLAQIGSRIFIAHSKPSGLQIFQVFSNQTALSAEILNIPEIPKNLGFLTDFIGFSITDTEEGILFLLFQGSLVGVHIQSGGASILRVQPIITEETHDFQTLRINYINDLNIPSNPLQIYILCQNKGLYRYNILLSTLNNSNAILEYDTKFFISIPYGRVFNHYRGRIFFIHTSVDSFQTYEYEILLTDSSLYYLNRIHNTDHLVKDIIVDNYYFILSGSNTQTVSWHSIHPSILADITPIQQVYSIHGFVGGFVQSFSNTSQNQPEYYFVGFQTHHVFIYKAIHIKPYLLCEPKSSSDYSNVVGQHRLILTLVQQRFQDKNSFQVEERKSSLILEVNQIYGDTKIAYIMVGGIISIVIVLILAMGMILCKIRKQIKEQYQLFEEIDMLKNSESGVNQIKGEEQEVIELKDYIQRSIIEGNKQVQEKQKNDDLRQQSFRNIRRNKESFSTQDGCSDKDNLGISDELKLFSGNTTSQQQDKLLGDRNIQIKDSGKKIFLILTRIVK